MPNFYTNLHKLFCQFIIWKKWVNSGKFMENCWIPCQVMVDMEKIYGDLIIINLYNFCGFLRKPELYRSWRPFIRRLATSEERNKTQRTHKGQLISEWNFSIFKSPKKPTKFFRDYCPMKLEICQKFGWLFGRFEDTNNLFATSEPPKYSNSNSPNLYLILFNDSATNNLRGIRKEY